MRGQRKKPVNGGPAGEGSGGLHPRSAHRARYDLPLLVKACPELAPFVAPNPFGGLTIDFADPRAVRALNRALLIHFYGVAHWDLPPEFLCPPIPGRADYLHHLADLLAEGGDIPRGAAIRVLDIGTGANCIYPLIGHQAYGWRFVGSELDPKALAVAGRILQANPGLSRGIELRHQAFSQRVFEGILEDGERFELTMCNPPFHASLREAREGTCRKWRNLGRSAGPRQAPVLNFGGQGSELWCPGGEAAFITRMIEESRAIPGRCLWFTTLVSKSSNLPPLKAALKRAGACTVRILEMSQGQKKSRILAWSFLSDEARRDWRRG